MCASFLGWLNHKRQGCFQEIKTGGLDAAEDSGKLMSLTFFLNRRKTITEVTCWHMWVHWKWCSSRGKNCKKNWTDQFYRVMWCPSVVSISASRALNGSLAALPPPGRIYRHPFSWLSIPIWATTMWANKWVCKWDFEKGHFSLYANNFTTDWWHSGNNAKINQW